MIEVSSTSVQQTKAIAAAVAELARPGDLVLLAGDLGAGKTAFTQGFGAALGVEERITSPTFTLVAQHQGRLVLNHLDVYRLEQLEEAHHLGLGELLDEGGVTVIEWGDAILPALPASYLEIRFAFGKGDDDRAISFVPVGKRWTARVRALTTALAPWIEPPFDAVAGATANRDSDSNRSSDRSSDRDSDTGAGADTGPRPEGGEPC